MKIQEELDHFREHYTESMEEMFAAVSDLYARYYGDFFHFPIFTKQTQSREAAMAETHRYYLNLLDISGAPDILELACGRGGFTNVLAENTNGQVWGIDISQSQLRHAKKKFKRDNLRFLHHDIMNVIALDKRFDRIIFMDADCYLPDKQKAIQEITKIMQPGARFLLLSWSKQEGLRAEQEELALHPFMKYWAIPSLETTPNYLRFFKENHLRVLETRDLNTLIRPNWEFGYQRALDAIKELKLQDLPPFIWKRLTFGKDGIRLIKEQFPAALYIKVCFDLGFLRYVLHLVEKPIS